MLHKIKTVTAKALASGKTVYQVLLEDGQQGSSWDEEFAAADGKELEFDITPNQKNSQYLDFRIKKAAKGFNTAPRNYRPDALLAAATFCAPRDLKGADVIKLAEAFHTWIRSS